MGCFFLFVGACMDFGGASIAKYFDDKVGFARQAFSIYFGEISNSKCQRTSCCRPRLVPLRDRKICTPVRLCFGFWQLRSSGGVLNAIPFRIGVIQAPTNRCFVQAWMHEGGDTSNSHYCPLFFRSFFPCSNAVCLSIMFVPAPQSQSILETHNKLEEVQLKVNYDIL